MKIKYNDNPPFWNSKCVSKKSNEKTMKLASKTITTIRKKDISKHLKAGHPQNIVTLLWGAEGEYQTLKKYSFRTQKEAEAFKLALDECRTWNALKWSFVITELCHD
jgi:hypothetical protein